MSDTQRIQHIDAWRFIAVSLVIQATCSLDSNFSFLVTTYPFLRRLGNFGTWCLIFFFISGFVICRGLIEERAGHLG
jgi:peptidoglycan/LPS O-acetylase OafA/YrhL